MSCRAAKLALLTAGQQLVLDCLGNLLITRKAVFLNSWQHGKTAFFSGSQSWKYVIISSGENDAIY